jgi:hypothetical protein
MTGAYGEGAMGFNTNNYSDLTWGSYKARGWDDPNLISYQESHDEERIMFKTISGGNTSQPDYEVRDTTIGLQRAALAANLFFTIPGPKMIWEFEELGYDYSINYPCGTSSCRLNPKPPRWDYQSQWRREYLHNVYASLIELKKTQPVFETTNYTTDLKTALKKIILRDPSMNAVALGNFDVVDREMILEFPSTGKWYEYFTGDSLTASGSNDTLQLRAGEYRLYTSVRLPKPLFTGVNEVIPSTIGHLVVFPNPSSDHFHIIAPKTIQEVEVYSILGMRVTTRVSVDGNKATIGAENLPAGTYVLRMISEDGQPYTGKLIKTRN